MALPLSLSLPDTRSVAADCPDYKPSAKFPELLSEGAAESAAREQVVDGDRVASLVDESEKMFERLKVENESEGDFENLFAQFQQMKGASTEEGMQGTDY